MYTANPDCVAYFYELSECHESNGLGMIGALPDSLTSRIVYINKSMNPGKLSSVLSKLWKG